LAVAFEQARLQVTNQSRRPLWATRQAAWEILAVFVDDRKARLKAVFSDKDRPEAGVDKFVFEDTSHLL
jgi:hypothetical protein